MQVALRGPRQLLLPGRQTLPDAGEPGTPVRPVGQDRLQDRRRLLPAYQGVCLCGRCLHTLG